MKSLKIVTKMNDGKDALCIVFKQNDEVKLDPKSIRVFDGLVEIDVNQLSTSQFERVWFNLDRYIDDNITTILNGLKTTGSFVKWRNY